MGYGIDHGTERGYQQHRYRGVEIPDHDPCGCRAAHNAHARQGRALVQHEPWTLERIRHGTNQGYKQHRRHGLDIPKDDTCGCLAAHSDYTRTRKAEQRERARADGASAAP